MADLDSGLHAGTPHPALAAYVDPYVGYRESGDRPGRHHGMPSLRLTAILAFDEPIDLNWLDQPRTRSRFWTLASGLHSRPVEIHHDGRQHGIQLSLTPLGCRALFGRPAGDLARTLIDLDDVFTTPVDDLADDPWAARFARLDRALLDAVDSDARLPHPELAYAWRLLETSGASRRVADIALAVGWSRRRLSERFRAEFGVTVKEAARIRRFELSRRRVDAGQTLAAVAADCGYADQPHLNREWRALAGYSPREYLVNERPNLQDPTPALPAG